MYVRKTETGVVRYAGPQMGAAWMAANGWMAYAGTLPTERLDVVDGAVVELPEPEATEEWVPISAFVGALYALVPPEAVAQVLQTPATLKQGVAGMALLSSDAAPGGMINLLDARVADWLTLVGLTVDQVRAAMAAPAAETEAEGVD